MIQRGDQDADDARVDAAEGAPHELVSPDGAPKRKHGGHYQHAGSEDADQSKQTIEKRVRGRTDAGAEIRTEREERAGQGLGCAITCKKRLLRHPSTRDNCVFKQRQNDMSASEYECSGVIEGRKHVEPLRCKNTSKERERNQ